MAASDLNGSVKAMVETLDDARKAVRRELSQCRAQVSPGAPLRQLHKSVRSFAIQSNLLVATVLERDLDDHILDRAEELFDFFHEAQDQLDEMLKPTSG